MTCDWADMPKMCQWFWQVAKGPPVRKWQQCATCGQCRKTTPRHGLAAQPAASPMATSPGQVSPAVPGASTSDRS